MKFGRYEVTQELGRGAMSIVYKALDPVIDRWVAVKVIHSKFKQDKDLQSEFNRRIILEAKMAGKLNHPNIVTVFDAGIDNDLCYIVMQLVNGQMLKEIIDETGSFSVSDAVSICLQICNAIDYAHRNQIIHRDIKPSNIMIDNENTVLVMDFGISSIDHENSGDIDFMGTPYFLAPEIILHKPFDHRVDIYAIGIILYQLLTGKRPFDGETMEDLFNNIVENELIAPSSLNPQITPELERVVITSLAKNPSERFDSTREFANHLEAFLQESTEANRSLLPKLKFIPSTFEKKVQHFVLADNIVTEIIESINQRDADRAARIISCCQEDLGEQLVRLLPKNTEQMRTLAGAFVLANDFNSAAKVYEDMGAYNMAVTLYKESSDYLHAAELSLRIGNELEAAQFFEMHGNHNKAADIYMRIGRVDAAASNFEKIGDYMKAAKCFNQAGMEKKAVQVLQKIPPDHPGYFDSLLLITDILDGNDYSKLALQSLSSAVSRLKFDTVSVPLFHRLGMLQFKLKNYEQARQTFDRIQEFYPGFHDTPQILKRIEEIIEREDYIPEPEDVTVDKIIDFDDDREATIASSKIVPVIPDVEFLKSSPLFSQLTLEEIKSLYNISEIRTVSEGEEIIPQGEPGRGLKIIINGSVSVQVKKEDKIRQVTTLYSGSYVGEMSLIDDYPTSAQVVAREDSKILFIDKNKFQELLNTDSQLRAKLMQVFINELSNRLRKTTSDLALLEPGRSE